MNDSQLAQQHWMEQRHRELAAQRAGVSALGMRVLRPDLPPGVPSAVLVQR